MQWRLLFIATVSISLTIDAGTNSRNFPAIIVNITDTLVPVTLFTSFPSNLSRAERSYG